jgi:prevent-host-death family protein
MTILTMNSHEARANWRELLDRVLSGNADIVIERNGKPVAVMIPFEDYEEILDELDDLRAGQRAAAIYEDWKRNPSLGQPIEEVEAEFQAEGLLDA